MNAPNRLLVVLALLLVAPASAQSPEEKAHRAGTELSLSEIVKETDAACGTKLTAHIEWKTFGADAKGHSVSSYCGAPLEALQDLCQGKHARAYIRARLRSFTCRQAKSGETALTPRSGALEWQVAFDTANLEAFAWAELLRKL